MAKTNSSNETALGLPVIKEEHEEISSTTTATHAVSYSHHIPQLVKSVIKLSPSSSTTSSGAVSGCLPALQLPPVTSSAVAMPQCPPTLPPVESMISSFYHRNPVSGSQEGKDEPAGSGSHRNEATGQIDITAAALESAATPLMPVLESEIIYTDPVPSEWIAKPEGANAKFCAACSHEIRDPYLLSALGLYWHEGCLCCSCCGLRFMVELGQSLYLKANLILCKRDYVRYFGRSGVCNKCKQIIQPDEMVMKAKDLVYHIACFACQQCKQRFNTGDKLYVCEGRILCEYDFEEQNLIASIQRGCQYSSIVRSRKAAENLRELSLAHGRL